MLRRRTVLRSESDGGRSATTFWTILYSVCTTSHFNSWALILNICKITRKAQDRSVGPPRPAVWDWCLELIISHHHRIQSSLPGIRNVLGSQSSQYHPVLYVSFNSIWMKILGWTSARPVLPVLSEAAGGCGQQIQGSAALGFHTMSTLAQLVIQ